MEPQNSLVSDFTGVELPQMEISKEDLIEEKKMAKFSRTAEFKKLKEWCEGRIEFYQTKLPNGLEVGLEAAPSAEDWRVANRVIGEFRLLLNQYETAEQAVKNSKDV